MYSPEQYHIRVPRERKRNLRFRLFILRRCREDVRFRKAVLEMCRKDIFFFINTFVWQFNPNAIGKFSTTVGPFITPEYQETAVRTILKCIEERSDCILEKSRDMGASWLCLIVMLWFWLFHPMSKFLCVSRNADAVDDREDSDSLFWKLDYIIEHLPEWVIEKKDFSRKVMSFKNHKNGSMITGQATSGKAGVGGRCLAMFVDEFSQIDEARELYDRTSDTTACRIFNGTHKGTGTCFHELTVKANSTPNLVKIVMHWTMHPDKFRGAYEWNRFAQRIKYLDPDYVYPDNYKFITDGSPTGGPSPGIRSPWYDEQCLRKGSARGIAADLDINPSGSVEQVFDALMISELIASYSKPPTHTLELEWHKLDAEPVRFHDQAGGKIKLWQRLPPDGKPIRGYYVFGADIATGTGATPSCLSGCNAQTGEKILEYADANIEPKDFTYLCVAICRLFTNEEGGLPKLIWEVQGPGNTFTKHVLALGYRNVYLRTSEYRIKRDQTDSPGWTNSPDSMKALIEDYKTALRDRLFLNRSEDALEECLAFNYVDGGDIKHSGAARPKSNSGARSNHGDRVIADALCWKLISEGKRLVSLDDPNSRLEFTEPVKQQGSLAWRAELARIRRRESDQWA